MATELFDNLTASGTSVNLTAGVSSTDTVLPVSGPASANLQASGGQFRVIIVNPNDGTTEIALVTGNASTSNWTVQRGAESAALSFPIGSQVKHVVTRASLLSLSNGGGGGGGGGSTAASPTGNSTTDTATVLAAMQSGLPLADGNYVCTAEGLNLAAGVKCMLSGQGSGRTTISFPSSAQNHTGIYVSGSVLGSKYNLAAQGNVGSQTITLSSADATALAANPGDYLQLWSSKLWPATDSNGAVQGEIVRVQSVNTGTGVITLYNYLDDTYALADTARLRKISLLSDCYIEGVTLLNTTPLAGASEMVNLQWTRNFRMRDVICVLGDGPGVQVTDSVGADFEIKVRDLADDQSNLRFGYGVLAWGATRDSKFTIDAERCRHGFTTGGDALSGIATNPQHCGVPRHIEVRGHSRETTNAGWDTHSQGDDISFWVTSNSCASAFNVRAKNVKVMSWTFHNCRDSAYMRWTATGLRVFPGSSRGTLTGSQAAWVIGDQGGTVLSDVKFFGLHSDSEGSYGVIINQNVTDVVLVDPVISNPGTGIAFLVQTGANNIRIINPATDGVTTLVNNTTGNSNAVSVISPGGPTPVDLAASPYNLKGDFKTVTDAAITTGTNILTSATAAFVATDVGKSINVAGAGASGAYLSTTIAGFTNATTVTTTANASTTVSGATMGFGTNNRSLFVSAVALNGGTTYYLQTGNYYIDISGGAIVLPDGATITGDGWQSILICGPEGMTTSTNFFATATSSTSNVRYERFRMVGPQTFGVGGSVFATAMSGAGRATLRDVNIRLFTAGMQCSGNGGVIDMQNCEIEGRASAGGSAGINHTGTSGEIRADDVYVWNFGGASNASAIIATTGVNVSVTRCKFDAQTGSGVVVDHFDTLGSAPTANVFSRIIGNEFGAALSATNVRTPYQGSCQVKHNDFNSPVRSMLITGAALVEGNHFISAAASANFHMIDMGGVTTPITSVPFARFTANRFEGIAQYAVYSNAAGDAEISDNDFLIGNGTTAASGEVRFDASVTAGSRINIKNNRFGGQTSGNFCIKISQGIASIIGNHFYGTYSGGTVASESGTPAVLRVRNNQFDQTSTCVVLTTSPTVLDVQGNFGASIDAGYRSANSNLTVQATHDLIGITSTAAARTITLQAITATSKGKIITVIDESNAAATNNITVTCAGADTFLGAATTKVINTNGGVLRFYSNGTNWVQV